MTIWPCALHAGYLLQTYSEYVTLFHCNNGCTNAPQSYVIRSGVPRGCSNPPPIPLKFRSFDKAEPNSQFRGKYIRNNLTRIRLSLIFWVVSWKALPASYDPPQWYFFLSKAWRDISIKYQKLRKFYHMKWNFLYQITAASRTPDWGATAPQIPVLSVLNWIC